MVSCPMGLDVTDDVLKFWTQVVSQKGLDKQRSPKSDCFWRSSLTRIFSVCYTDKHFFLNSRPDNQRFIWEHKGKVFDLQTFSYSHIMHVWAVKVLTRLEGYAGSSELKDHYNAIKPIPGLNQYKARINVSCSRTQRSDTSEARTCNPSFSSQALYHWAAALSVLFFVAGPLYVGILCWVLVL